MNTSSIVFILALIVTLPFSISCKPGPARTPDTAKKEDTKKTIPFDEAVFDCMRTFAEVLHTIGQKHYLVNDIEESMSKAIDSFLICLDPHSGFLNEKKYKSILESTSGESFGIGVLLENTRQQNDKFLLIIDTIPEGPADSVGVKPLDKIIEINGLPLEGMTTEEAMSHIKGERYTTVHIKVLRENHPDLIDFDIKRDKIEHQDSLCFYIENQNIYYLALTSFTDNAVKQIEKLLQNVQKKQYKGLILDLRNNSGGLLNAAIDIAALFLDKGSEVVSTKDKNNKVSSRYVTSRDPVSSTPLPIFILINNYTASAAEILAGCLCLHSEKYAEQSGTKNQQKLLVFIVGTQSFGKGSVQEVIPVGNNCGVKITTSLYFLPFDTAIQGIGIKPDFKIKKQLPPTEQMEWFNKHYGSERALHHSIKSGNNENDASKTDKNGKETKARKPDKEKSWSERAKEGLSKDNQLKEVISLINILDAAQTLCPDAVSNRKKAVEFLNKLHIPSELELTEVKI